MPFDAVAVFVAGTDTDCAPFIDCGGDAPDASRLTSTLLPNPPAISLPHTTFARHECEQSMRPSSLRLPFQ